MNPVTLFKMSCRAQAALLSCIAVLCTASLFLHRDTVNFAYTEFPDDALFYNVIAHNMVSGSGVTSDGIGRTNGFHPLWMVVMILLTVCSPQAVPLEILVQFLVSVLIFYLMLLFLFRYTSRWIACCMVLIAAVDQSFFRVLYSGMESSLAMLFLLTTLLMAQKFWTDPDNRKIRITFSLSLALLFFARLDGILMWIAFSAVFLFSSSRKAGVRARSRQVFSCLTIPGAAALIYFVFNYLTYHTVMPISGVIKSYSITQILSLNPQEYFSRAMVRLGYLYSMSFIELPLSRILKVFGGEALSYVPLLYGVSVCLVIGAGLFQLFKKRQADFSLQLLTAYVALHTFYYCFLQYDTYSLSWAHGPQLLFVALACCRVVWCLQNSIRLNVALSFKVSMLLIVFLLTQTYNIRARWPQGTILNDFRISIDDFQSALSFINNTIPENAVIATHNLGFIGYLSQRKVMSADGLLNSYYYYAQYFKTKKIYAYLTRYSIKYIAEVVPEKTETVPYILKKYPGLTTDGILFIKEFTTGLTLPEIARKYAVILLK